MLVAMGEPSKRGYPTRGFAPGGQMFEPIEVPDPFRYADHLKDLCERADELVALPLPVSGFRLKLTVDMA